MSPIGKDPHALPKSLSEEFLRKEAKRRAKKYGCGLAAAQHILARKYSATSWGELIRRVRDHRTDAVRSRLTPLSLAAHTADIAGVERLLGEGDRKQAELDRALWQVCRSEESSEPRIAVAKTLLRSGASPRHMVMGSTALHAAASQGPLALVELLIQSGAMEWQQDRWGRTPEAVAKRGSASDKPSIVTLLARPAVRSPIFRKAIAAIQNGDVAELARLLDREPRLLLDRIEEPECYQSLERDQYFLNPKLFWFVANNPRLTERMPGNMVEVAREMIRRGVEKDDLDYTLGLVATSASAREHGLQVPLVHELLAAGAHASVSAIESMLGHGEVDPVQALVDSGYPLSLSISAALGMAEPMQRLLPHAAPAEVQMALALAVINGQCLTARLALQAGADPNQFMPVHKHSLPLHQAALLQDLDLMALLVSHGARTDLPDRLWNGTPLDWAIHEGKVSAQQWLESR